MIYQVFHRTWWTPNPSWPDGREPGAGEVHHIDWAGTEEEARAKCEEWNAAHDPGPMSDKAEYWENDPA